MDLLYGRLDAATLAHASECAALTVEVDALRKALNSYTNDGDDDDEEVKRQHLLKDPPPHVLPAAVGNSVSPGRQYRRPLVAGAQAFALPKSLEARDDGQVGVEEGRTCSLGGGGGGGVRWQASTIAVCMLRMFGTIRFQAPIHGIKHVHVNSCLTCFHFTAYSSYFPLFTSFSQYALV